MRNCWVSILALVMSVIALMLSYRVAPIDFKDYWGFCAWSTKPISYNINRLANIECV